MIDGAKGGGLGCNWSETRVMSLAWNDKDQVLYIGGKFLLVMESAFMPTEKAAFTFWASNESKFHAEGDENLG